MYMSKDTHRNGICLEIHTEIYLHTYTYTYTYIYTYTYTYTCHTRHTSRSLLRWYVCMYMSKDIHRNGICLKIHTEMYVQTYTYTYTYTYTNTYAYTYTCHLCCTSRILRRW